MQKQTIEDFKLNVVKRIYAKVSYNKTRHFNKVVLQVYKMIK